MSLLLNALKKSEDGADAEKQAAAGAGAPPVVDFDGLEDPAEGQAGGAQKERHQVDAARVFEASEADTQAGTGAVKKIVTSVLVLLIGVGGIYGILRAEVIPGFDLSLIENLMGDAPVQVTQSAPSIAEQLQVADDVKLLPIPIVDVQSEIDINSFRQPENSAANVDADEYRQRIARLTGYDVKEEREKRRAEEEALRGELDALREEEAELSPISEPAIEEENEGPVFVTAESSRQLKAALFKRTPSDSELNIALASGGELPFAKGKSPDSNVAAADSSAGGEGESTTEAGAQASDAVDVQAQAASTAETAAPASTRTSQVAVDKSPAGADRKARLEQARLLYHRGDLVKAEAAYRDVLREDETNRDALRGLALVAVATGRYQLAVATYLDILGYYPNDPVAIAEIVNLRASNKGSSFYEVERTLKQQIGKHARSVDGVLYFSLGNLYAENGKWTQAQEAYFEAFSSSSKNPDYAYNLAVVLDYLNKPALALQYYQEALSLSEGLTVGFNRSQVRSRINDLN